MAYSKDKRYHFNGIEVKFIRDFNHRGILSRFTYLNGSCFDIRPGDGYMIKEIIEEKPSNDEGAK